jgi:hypothetical protein
MSIADHESNKDANFCKFCCQLLHSSLAKMLESLWPGMTKPDIVCCPDGHFWWAIYGLGLYIADYPEQALLACIMQNWCPKYISGPSLIICQPTCLYRCTAPPDHLDDDTYGCCSRGHTDVLVQGFELGVLWDEYGLVRDIVVGIISLGLVSTFLVCFCISFLFDD